MVELRFRQLEVFVQVVERGSVGRAAAQLDISPVSARSHVTAFVSSRSEIELERAHLSSPPSAFEVLHAFRGPLQRDRTRHRLLECPSHDHG
jgi:hypothetical protein